MEIIYHVLAILGGGAVIIIGLSKFLGGIWRDRIKEKERRRTEEQLECIRHRRMQADQFITEQYKVYKDLWSSLQSLKFAVDCLWEKASLGNVAALAHQLEDTERMVNNWSIFFADNHLNELKQLFKTLGDFKAGKKKLIELRTKQDIENVNLPEIESQIERNREYREKFENLLNAVRKAIQKKLSSVRE